MPTRLHLRTVANFNRRRRLTMAAVVAIVMSFACFAPLASADHPSTVPAKPNIVLVLADDLGYGDLACYGHPDVKTPHLDRFAQQGLRLTHCYSAGATCSPSRCGLMTGRTPYRVGIHSQIPFLSPMHLRESETTIAELLRDAGYDTCHAGKWHLNGMFNLPGQPQPREHGFRHSLGTQNNCLPNHKDPYNFVRNGIPVGPRPGYAADIVADEAVTWLREGRDEAKPFFLYVAFHEPHEPIRSAAKYEALYDYPDDPSRKAYYANISQMDAGFGRLLAALDELQLSDDTLVWFTSDNGPARTRWHAAGSTGGLRGFKGQLFEGGIRVPGLLRWPRRIAAGSVSDVPVSGVDFLPTVCAAVGIAPPDDRTLDGANILPLLEGDEVRRPKPLYWQFNLAGGDEKLALRHGRWKIVAELSQTLGRQGASITNEFNRMLKSAEPVRWQLYDLAADPAEAHDVAKSEAAQLAEMKSLLDAYYHDVRSETPAWPAWDDPGYEAPRIEWPDYTAKPLTAKPAK